MAKYYMQKVDKEEAAKMRENGFSLQEIADRFGVSRQRIGILFRKTGRVSKKPTGLDSVVFPNIRKFLSDNRMSIKRFSNFCQSDYNSVLRGIKGYNDMQKHTIDDILRATGMTYEEAFKEDEKE